MGTRLPKAQDKQRVRERFFSALLHLQSVSINLGKIYACLPFPDAQKYNEIMNSLLNSASLPSHPNFPSLVQAVPFPLLSSASEQQKTLFMGALFSPPGQ